MRKIARYICVCTICIFSIVFLCGITGFSGRSESVESSYYESLECKNGEKTLEEYREERFIKMLWICLLTSITSSILASGILVISFACINYDIDEEDGYYSIIGTDKKEYIYTAKTLYKILLKKSKSNYNWGFSARSIVDVISKESFDKFYGEKIKILILNCFSELELKKENMLASGCEGDSEAVLYVYNTLDLSSFEALMCKERYLKSIISGVVKYSEDTVRLVLHFGPKYSNFLSNFKEEKYLELKDVHICDFDVVRNMLNESFKKSLHDAEEMGAFEEEDKEYLSHLCSFEDLNEEMFISSKL